MTDVLEKKTPDATRADVVLWGIGTAVPTSVMQTDLMSIVEQFSCQTDGQRAWLRRVFSRSGVEQRGSILLNGRGLQDAQDFYGVPAVAGEKGPGTAQGWSGMRGRRRCWRSGRRGRRWNVRVSVGMRALRGG